MPDQKDTVLGRLAVERGYLTQAELDEAIDLQRKMHDEFGMDQPLEHVLVGKHLLSRDQAQELGHAAAIQTVEARLVAGYEVISKLGHRLPPGEFLTLSSSGSILRVGVLAQRPPGFA